MCFRKLEDSEKDIQLWPAHPKTTNYDPKCNTLSTKKNGRSDILRQMKRIWCDSSFIDRPSTDIQQ